MRVDSAGNARERRSPGAPFLRRVSRAVRAVVILLPTSWTYEAVLQPHGVRYVHYGVQHGVHYQVVDL